MKHRHSLTARFIDILKKAMNTGLDSFHLQKDLTLTKNEYANFQKLRYWGLVENYSGQKSGHWSITQLGKVFLLGKISVHKHVVTFNNKVLSTEGPMINVLSAEENDYKKRQTYIAEAQPVEELSGQIKLFPTGKFNGDHQV